MMMNKKDIDMIVRNILHSSDMGCDFLKQIIINQWKFEKRIEELEDRIKLLEAKCR